LVWRIFIYSEFLNVNLKYESPLGSGPSYIRRIKSVGEFLGLNHSVSTVFKSFIFLKNLSILEDGLLNIE